MPALKDVIAYILKEYPPSLKQELSNARVTKMIYLADWHQAINCSRQITSIDWYFDNYGPYVDDIRTTAMANPSLFCIDSTQNMHGQPKMLLTIKDEAYQPNLNDDQKASLNHVIEKTKTMYWDSFIKLVYSTYPIMSSERYTHMNLIQKSNEYKNQKKTLTS